MTALEKALLAVFAEILPRLGEQEKKKLLAFGEALARGTERDSPGRTASNTGEAPAETNRKGEDPPCREPPV